MARSLSIATGWGSDLAGTQGGSAKVQTTGGMSRSSMRPFREARAELRALMIYELKSSWSDKKR